MCAAKTKALINYLLTAAPLFMHIQKADFLMMRLISFVSMNTYVVSEN